MGDDLTDFLLARIAEDEDTYRGAMHMGCVEDDSDGPDVIHSATCPNRVLAECEAKRGIVEEFLANTKANYWEREAPGLEIALRYLALAYADHEDFREEWKP